MELLVAYDIATDTPQGERRLRRVAQACEGFGQRVQNSVFECSVSALRREQLIQRLLQELEPAQDSLRIYRLPEPRGRHVTIFGVEPRFDLRGALVL